jgi:hypothetical protein
VTVGIPEWMDLNSIHYDMFFAVFEDVKMPESGRVHGKIV